MKPLRIETKRAVIASDWHIPCEDTPTVNAILNNEATSDTDLIIAGDFLEEEQFSRFEPEEPLERQFSRDVAVASRILKTLATNFRVVYLFLGNHDYRLAKRLNGLFPVQMLFDAVIKRTEKRNIVFSPYTFAYMNRSWMICHPHLYAKAPLITARKLVEVHKKNIISAHEHHLGIGFDPSGRYATVNTGCVVDVKKVTYRKLWVTDFPAWITGYVVYKAEENFCKIVPTHRKGGTR